MWEESWQWLNAQRSWIHLVLHVAVPAMLAWGFAKPRRIKIAFMLMMATMLVDADHLLATPIYAPNRCSILFHPLHQVVPIIGYGLMLLWPLILRVLNKRIQSWEIAMGWIGLGLLIHMALDGIDCVWMKLV